MNAVLRIERPVNVTLNRLCFAHEKIESFLPMFIFITIDCPHILFMQIDNVEIAGTAYVQAHRPQMFRQIFVHTSMEFFTIKTNGAKVALIW